MTRPVLELDSVTKRFGGLVAVDGFTATVDQDIILGIIGPNGAGKSTLLGCISGIYRIDGGQIWLQGKPVSGLKPYQITRLGIGRTFQVPRLFYASNLVENVMAPALDSGADMASLRRKALALLEYVGLSELSDHLARELSGGQQKLLEFARMLMFDPVLLILDEPFGGVHPDVRAKLYEKIRDLQRAGKAFILVSHEMSAIYALSTIIMVMHNGRKIAEGQEEDIKANESVLAAYLG